MSRPILFFFFSSRRRHTSSSTVSWARRCVRETGQKRDANRLRLPVPANSAHHRMQLHIRVKPVTAGRSCWKGSKQLLTVTCSAMIPKRKLIQSLPPPQRKQFRRPKKLRFKFVSAKRAQNHVFCLLPDYSERLRNETRHIKRQLKRRH